MTRLLLLVESAPHLDRDQTEALLSGELATLVDNPGMRRPLTATMVPVVEQLQEGNSGDNAYWSALAIGACFGGNATLIAAAANVTAAAVAARAGRPIGFVTFLKVGLPATALSMALATFVHRDSVPVSKETQ